MMNDLVPAAKKGGRGRPIRCKTTPCPGCATAPARSAAACAMMSPPRATPRAKYRPRCRMPCGRPARRSATREQRGRRARRRGRPRAPKVGEASKQPDGCAGSSGVGGAISDGGPQGRRCGGAAVDTTKYVTGETSRIVFWLSMLSGICCWSSCRIPKSRRRSGTTCRASSASCAPCAANRRSGRAGTDLEYTGDAGV